jgi:hypothetical protein
LPSEALASFLRSLQMKTSVAREVHAGTVHFDRLGVEVDDEAAGLDHRLGVTLRAAHDGMDAAFATKRLSPTQRRDANE